VDVLGLPVFSVCTKANVTDNEGLVAMFIKNKSYFIERPNTIPPLAVLLDRGYQIDVIISKLQQYPEILCKVSLGIAPKISKEMKNS
jgi:hypothetical protein